MKKKHSFKDRFRYWFDNQMAKGSSSMIKMLAVATLIVVTIISLVIFFACADDELSLFESFWDSFATVINAWMPYSSDGSSAYLVLTAIVAVVGLLFTSVLIGIVSTYIEDKLTDLRKGSSTILEEDHIVVLGFATGEYTLISQLVEAAGDSPRCIVIAEAMEKDEMESDLKDNIETPKNVRLICRNVDICDPVSLECCAIPDCSSVIVNPTDNARTIRTILAVRKLLIENDVERKIPIISAVSDSRYLLPKYAMEAKNIILLHTSDMIGRVIAHSATQIGLAKAFTEVFNFDGSEFYVSEYPALEGKTFGEISDMAENGVPVGIIRKNESLLVPEVDAVFGNGDGLLYFAESKNAISFNAEGDISDTDLELQDDSDGKVLILGKSDILSLVKDELPEDLDELEVVESFDIDDLENQVSDADHVILLSDPAVKAEEADMQSIMTLLNLRDIRTRKEADYNITVEMQNEKDRNLVMLGDTTDFIVASDITAMILAQLAENNSLYRVFRELLSNDGREFVIKKVIAKNTASMTVGALRHNLLKLNHIILGYIKETDDGIEVHLNPAEDTELSTDGSTNLIVIGE